MYPHLMSTVHLRKLLMQWKNNPKINFEGPISVTKDQALAIIGKINGVTASSLPPLLNVFSPVLFDAFWQTSSNYN